MKDEISPEAVLSHEHLHLLQHRNRAPDTRYVRGLEALVEDKWIANPMTAYLLKDPEVEARLHEIVLSNYRAAKVLLLTIDAFLDMLCGCSSIGWIFVNALDNQEATPKRQTPPVL